MEYSDEKKKFWFRELQSSIRISACAIFGLAVAKNEKLISDFFLLFSNIKIWDYSSWRK